MFEQPAENDNGDGTVNNEVIQNIKSTIKILEQKVEKSEVKGKVFVKRNYKLMKNTPLNIWLDSLNSELQANELLEVIESECVNMDPEIRNTKLQQVRDIIISHLDDYYHNKVLTIKNPKEILLKIKEFRIAETNINASAIRAKLYQLKKTKTESVNSFCDRFDSPVREFELNCNNEPLSKDEKSAAFYQAVANVHPKLQTSKLINKQMGKDLTSDDMRCFILRLEAERQSETAKPTKPSEVQVQTASTLKSETKQKRCYR